MIAAKLELCLGLLFNSLCATQNVFEANYLTWKWHHLMNNTIVNSLLSGARLVQCTFFARGVGPQSPYSMRELVIGFTLFYMIHVYCFWIQLIESMDDKLSWMEVLNTATECETEPQEKFNKKRKSVRQRLNRRVSISWYSSNNSLLKFLLRRNMWLQFIYYFSLHVVLS